MTWKVWSSVLGPDWSVTPQKFSSGEKILGSYLRYSFACWVLLLRKEQTAHLHQKSYEYQQEMSSRIKTSKRDWHSKRGRKNLWFIRLWFQLRSFYLCASRTCLRVMTLEQRIFTKPLFHPPLIHFFFSSLRSCKGDRNTGLGCMALFVVVFASLFFFSKCFHMGRITSAPCVRHHFGFMLLWALPWMRWLALETKDSHSHHATPPFLAFNTPAWLTPADQDWGNASLVFLTPFMQLSRPHSTSLLTAYRRMQSVQFSSAVMIFTSYP